MPAKKAAKKIAPEAVAPAAKKTPATKKAVTKTARKAPVKKGSPKTSREPSMPNPDAIARTAYLIYRERVEKGLPGDQHGDWLEAERRLKS